MVLMVEVLDWAVAREVVRLFLQMLEGVEVPQVSDRQTAQTSSEMSKNVSTAKSICLSKSEEK